MPHGWQSRIEKKNRYEVKIMCDIDTVIRYKSAMARNHNEWNEHQISALEECIMYSKIGNDAAAFKTRIAAVECSARGHNKLQEFIKLSGYRLEFHPVTGLPKITKRA